MPRDKRPSTALIIAALTLLAVIGIVGIWVDHRHINPTRQVAPPSTSTSEHA